MYLFLVLERVNACYSERKTSTWGVIEQVENKQWSRKHLYDVTQRNTKAKPEIWTPFECLVSLLQLSDSVQVVLISCYHFLIYLGDLINTVNQNNATNYCTHTPTTVSAFNDCIKVRMIKKAVLHLICLWDCYIAWSSAFGSFKEVWPCCYYCMYCSWELSPDWAK